MKLKDLFFPSDKDNGSANITRQEMLDELFHHFRKRFDEETTTESMLFPTSFYVYMNEEDFNLRCQSLGNTVTDVVNRINRFLRRKKFRYSNYIPHSKYWLFQFTPLSPDTFIEGMPDDASQLQPKQLYIISTIYPQENTQNGGERMVGTMHVKDSFLIHNLAINSRALMGMDIVGRYRFKVPFADFSNIRKTPVSMAQQTTNSSLPVASLTIRQQQYQFVLHPMNHHAQMTEIETPMLQVGGMGCTPGIRNGIQCVGINSQQVEDPHLQIRRNPDGTFSIIAYAQVRLNEIPLAPNLWVPLPNFSVILINDEIQLNFRIDKP